MPHVLSRRAVIATLACLTTTVGHAQSPSQTAEFTKEAFDAAQAAGKSIVVEIAAPWCPVCKVQAPIIHSLSSKPDYKDVEVLKVDFDSEKGLLKELNVTKQSTLIAFKGKKETARSIGDTSADGIEKLFKSAL